MKQDTKDRIQYGSAVAMIASGIILTFLSFLMLHIVHSTVLAYVGEAIGFAGAVFGLTVYARSKGQEIEEKFHELETKLMKHENPD